MNKSESIKELNTALNKFQGEVTNPKNTENNPFFKSKYAPLDVILNTIRPVLTKFGLSVVQDVSGDGEKINVKTTLNHISGEWIETNTLTLNNSDNKGVSLAQAAGISITYARRYQLSAILGVSSEDDIDGNNSQQQNKKTDVKPGPVKAEETITLTQQKIIFEKANNDKVKVKEVIMKHGYTETKQIKKAELNKIIEEITAK